MTTSKRVYVASSWRCSMQSMVVHVLRAAGMNVYDFKHPPAGTGFHWSEVGVDSNGEQASTYRAALHDPRAVAGFQSDKDALDWCDTCVLVLPCGRSAHLELGYAIGQGKRTAILLDADPITPELMYKLADLVTPSMPELLAWLGVQDREVAHAAP